MQVSTARNAAMTPPQCPTTEAPGPYFQKEFFHNGYIKSLSGSYTSPQYARQVCSCHLRTPAGNDEKVDCWPGPEVPRLYRRQSRPDGSGGGPDRCLPADAHGQLRHPTPTSAYLYGYLHDRWLSCDLGNDFILTPASPARRRSAALLLCPARMSTAPFPVRQADQRMDSGRTWRSDQLFGGPCDDDEMKGPF
jgi:hypothetical protein